MDNLLLSKSHPALITGGYGGQTGGVFDVRIANNNP